MTGQKTTDDHGTPHPPDSGVESKEPQPIPVAPPESGIEREPVEQASHRDPAEIGRDDAFMQS
ncbi:hypothetical protein BD309DRAFT_1024756 [Dichomitus squalens]|nr:hypothetical protein BD309DRAFT_1024756 [Dichomitus squalens]